MSKQEKLAAVIHRVQEYAHGVGLVGPLGTRVKDAYCEYASTPDDPPQPPEMPECVRALLDYITEIYSRHCKSHEMAKAVRDHYRQPLKLEVGKVYEDEQGYLVDVVWHNTFFVDHFIGVRREGGLPRIYSSCGVCTAYCDSNIIKEVKHQ